MKIKAICFLNFIALIFLLGACSNQNAVSSNESGLNRVKILIADPGFYQVTLSELQDVGLSADRLVNEDMFLSLRGTAVPYWIHGNTLVFYGEAPTSRYTAVQPYILEMGKAGLAMMETSVPDPLNTEILDQVSVRLRLEENNIYKPESLADGEGDPWFWQTIDPNQSFPLSFDLSAVGDGSGILITNLWGATYNANVEKDHDFNVVLNDNNLETIRWDGQTHFTSRTEIPIGTLQPGDNRLVLDNEPEGATFLDMMNLNWIELIYAAPPVAIEDRVEFSDSNGLVTMSGFSERPLLFEVADPVAPTILTGWDYLDEQLVLAVTNNLHIIALGPAGFLAPQSIEPMRESDWKNEENQADLLIVTTDELAPAMDVLIKAREAQGLSVALVPVAEIYDEFGLGEATPDSINKFVTYTYEKWQNPRPAYLFLVGDATSDYRNHLGLMPQNHVPSPMVSVQYSGETVSDSRLADVDGDMKPDLAVGRWPVSTVTEVEQLVARTLAYEKSTAVNQALFATDGTEAQFAATAQRLWEGSNFTKDQTRLLNGAQANEVTAEWNAGAWLMTYIGHGSLELWGKENVFSVDSVGDLQTETPSIVLQLTCLTGLFAHPEVASLSETMLLHNKGSVLIISATSLTLSSDQEPFALNLLKNLQNPEFVRMGDAFQQAKSTLPIEANNGLREISDTFALLGDPTTRILRPLPKSK